MRKVSLRLLLFLTLAAAGFVGSGLQVKAQTYQSLINWNSVWHYDQSGRELGNIWRAFTYTEDGFWAQGPGLLGFEPDTPGNYTIFEDINTGLSVGNSVTNYYFRTFFNFNGPVAGLTLIATNLIDDGAVIYLNGTEVGRFRYTGNPNAAVVAAIQGAEGTPDLLFITNLTPLRQGQNLMAVEVHQSDVTSSDVMFGMALTALRSAPLSITNQPQSQFIVVGDPLLLSVGVSGGPAFYRWYKEGVFQNQQTNATLSVAASTANNAGNYFVIVSNSVSMVTSTVASVTVMADTVGPRVIDAVVDTNTFATRKAQTIAISFNEVLARDISTNAANFSVYLGSNYTTKLNFTNVFYNTGGRPTIYLWMSDPRWDVNTNCWVLINNVADFRGNVSFPNMRVGVSQQVVTNLTQMSDSWYFNDSQIFDPDVYSGNPAWYAVNYTNHLGTDPWWGIGQGIFYIDQIMGTPVVCGGDSLGRLVSFQNPPTLFRRNFTVPAGLSTNGSLRIRYIVDDGMNLYLNGKEIYRTNAPPGPVNEAFRATTVTVDAVCSGLTLPLSNLVSGVNVMAAAVSQGPTVSDADTIFGLEMDYVSLRTSRVPAEPTSACVLSLARVGANYRLSWNTNFSGYGLQFKTNLDQRLPWITISNQALPFTVAPVQGETRLFRLSKPL